MYFKNCSLQTIILTVAFVTLLTCRRANTISSGTYVTTHLCLPTLSARCPINIQWLGWSAIFLNWKRDGSAPSNPAVLSWRLLLGSGIRAHSGSSVFQKHGSLESCPQSRAPAGLHGMHSAIAAAHLPDLPMGGPTKKKKN